jgi:large subunit ribosomal protein L40e
MSLMKQSFLFILLCLGGNAFSINLYFKTLEGNDYNLDVEPSSTLDELKTLLEKKLERRKEGFRLIYSGKALTNNEETIKGLNLTKDTTIHIVFTETTTAPKKVNPEELMLKLTTYLKDLEDSVESLGDEKAALEEKIAGLKKENSFSQAENKELRKRIRNLEKALSSMKGVELKLRRKIDEQVRLMKVIAVFHKEKNETSRREIAELEKSLEEAQLKFDRVKKTCENKLKEYRSKLAKANINVHELATTVAALFLRNVEVEAENKELASALAAVRKKDLLRILRTSSNKNPEHRADVKEDLALWPEAARAEVEEASKKISHFIRYHKLRKSLGRAKNIFEDSKKPNRELSKMREILKALDPSQLEVQEAMERLFRSLEDIRISNSNKYEEAKAAREEAIKRFVCANFRM